MLSCMAPRQATVLSPSGSRYTVEIQPVGVPDTVPFGGAALEWVLGWVWHALRHRGRFRVKVTEVRRVRQLFRGIDSGHSAVAGSGTRREADELASTVRRQIEAGEFAL